MNIATVAAFQHRIRWVLPRFGDRGAMVAFTDPAGYILYPLYSGRALCHRIWRFPGRDGDCPRLGLARHDRQFRRRRLDGYYKTGAGGNLSDRVRPHDMGHRALPIDGRAAAGYLKTPDPRGAVSEACGRRASASAQEQSVDNSR